LKFVKDVVTRRQLNLWTNLVHQTSTDCDWHDTECRMFEMFKATGLP